MGRRIIITGSEGHLGRALRAAFEAEGDEVRGVDLPGTGAELQIDLDRDSPAPLLDDVYFSEPDIVICNAKTRTWEAHHGLAKCARQSIINISSIYGVLGSDPKMYEGTEVEPTPAYYAAAKGALISLTRWQATNLAPVRSNCVCPGGIYRGHSEEFVRRYEAKVPLRRMADESDVVPLCVFLASPAASYITGQIIMVDGGFSCM